jgi:DNA processing protein
MLTMWISSCNLKNDERLARLRLIRSDNVGPITFRQLMGRYGNAIDAIAALPELAKRGGRKKPFKVYPKSKAEEERAQAKKFGARFIILGDPFYPEMLKACEDAPPVLMAMGHIHLLEKPSLGMVGARNSSAVGIKLATQIATELGEAGLVITSGLARGIDAAAHKGALATGTIAVLGAGLDVAYPRENAELHESIGENGLLLSEHPLGTKPQASHFPRRNRIISGLSKGILVVEAALKSGSLITARLAGEQGREVFAIPGSPLDPRANGTNSLIKDGATLIESAEDIMESLSSLRSLPLSEPEYDLFDSGETGDMQEPADENIRNKILAKLNLTPIGIDEIIRLIDMPPQIILMTILELELAGLIRRHAGNLISKFE